MTNTEDEELKTAVNAIIKGRAVSLQVILETLKIRGIEAKAFEVSQILDDIAKTTEVSGIRLFYDLG